MEVLAYMAAKFDFLIQAPQKHLKRKQQVCHSGLRNCMHVTNREPLFRSA